MMITNDYGFDPSYGYTLEQLLRIAAPKAPKDFDIFWQARYQRALKIKPATEIKVLNKNKSGWAIHEMSYRSTDDFPIRGWLLLPSIGPIKRGFIIGHGYGGREAPDFHLPFTDSALFFPCFRGLSMSAMQPISSDPYWHVRHNIEDKNRYILGGCVEDIWLAVSALLELLPSLAGHLGYLGISFSGGIGALALAWEKRIERGHFNVPTFGHYPLRLRLATLGSARSVQEYYHSTQDKKKTLDTLRYFDAAIAAKHITMPIHNACAVYDPYVIPPGQFSVFNALTANKQLLILKAGHHSYPEQKEQEAILLNELDEFFAPLKLAAKV